MSAPEYRNMPTGEVPEPRREALSSDITECCHLAPADDRPTALRQQLESPMEIMERFIEQDQELGQDVELLFRKSPPAIYSPDASGE